MLIELLVLDTDHAVYEVLWDILILYIVSLFGSGRLGYLITVCIVECTRPRR